MKKDILKKKIGNLGGLTVGEAIQLDVTSDKKGRPVFKSSVHNLDLQGQVNPSMRIVPLSCTSGVALSKGEIWEGIICKVEATNRTITALGKDHKVIYIYVNSLKRIEEKSICFWYGKICCDVISGSFKIMQESIPATVKMRKFLDNGLIRNVEEISVAGRVVMRNDEGLLDEKVFVEAQNAMLRGSMFDLVGYKRRMPVLTAGQHATLGKLYMSWENLKTLHAENEGTAPASVESLGRLAARSSSFHRQSQVSAR